MMYNALVIPGSGFVEVSGPIVAWASIPSGRVLRDLAIATNLSTLVTEFETKSSEFRHLALVDLTDATVLVKGDVIVSNSDGVVRLDEVRPQVFMSQGAAMSGLRVVAANNALSAGRLQASVNPTLGGGFLLERSVEEHRHTLDLNIQLAGQSANPEAGTTITVDERSVTIRFDDGQLQRITKTMVVGSNPSLSRDHLLVVVPGVTVAASHWRLDVVGGQAVVQDLSTTGETSVRLPSGETFPLTSEPLPISRGAVVRFADRWAVVE